MARTPKDVTDRELELLQVLWEGGPAPIRRLAEVLYPEATNGALGRHVVGLWSDRAKYGEGREMEEALQEGQEVRSFHELPSVGELDVWVTTNPARTETVVEMAR